MVIDGIRDLMLDINNSTEATKLVGDLMQWTSEQNIHIQTVLPPPTKATMTARGHIGTELNNKAGICPSQVLDNTLRAKHRCSTFIIRSSLLICFSLKEMEDGMCGSRNRSLVFGRWLNRHHRFYHELNDTEHRNCYKPLLQVKSCPMEKSLQH